MRIINACACLVLAAAPAPGQGSILYGSDVSLDLLGSIDRNTGGWTAIGSYINCGAITGMAHDRNADVLYGCCPGNNSLYVMNQSTGLATLVGPTGFSNINGLAFDPNANVLYCTSLNGNNLFTVNTGTGAGTLVGTITGASNIEGLAFDPATNTLYGLDDTSDRVVVINQATAAATPLPNALPSTGLWRGLDWDSELGVIWATKVNPGQLARVDPATGSGVVIGVPTTFCQGLAIKGPAVLEYQVNQPGASLTVNGIQGTAQAFALVNLGSGQNATASLSSTNQGQPWELAVGAAPLVPQSQGALVTSDGQVFNLAVTDPALTFAFNLFQSPPFVNVVVPVAITGPSSWSFQMAVLDPSAASGVRLSQPVRLLVQ